MIGQIPNDTVAGEVRRIYERIKFYSQQMHDQEFMVKMFPYVKLLINLWMKLLRTQAHDALVHECFPEIVRKVNSLKQTAVVGGYAALRVLLDDTFDDMRSQLRI